MKRLNDLWEPLVSFENLWLAWCKARKGKRGSSQVGAFELGLESNLLALQQELQSGTYRPGRYRLFTIYERKQRLIAAAPFRDRVVHHALMNLTEPPLDRRFIFDSYACRRGKGTHAAVDRYQAWAPHYRYVLKLDNRNNNLGFRLASPPLRPGIAVFKDAVSVASGDHEPVSRPRREGRAK